jgi:NADPH:quinone reductase-like Zn-dependent oxidoreductase
MPNGATHAANYTTEDFSAVIKDVTGGKGADIVVDFVVKTHWNQNIESLATDGRMIILAALSGMLIVQKVRPETHNSSKQVP